MNTPHAACRTPHLRTDALLFGESSGRIVVSCPRGYAERIEHLAGRHGVPTALIGQVGGSRLTIAPWVDAPVDALNDAWRSGLAHALQSSA